MLKTWRVTPPNYNTKVTVELNDLIENGVDIWGFEYGSYYTGEAKKEFEQKVLDRYRFRQIGQETVGRFLHYFRTLVKEKMPYYKELYHSVDLMHSVDDPFQAYDLTETFEKTSSNNGTSTDTNTNSETVNNVGANIKKFSDTPQNYIGNLNDYLTEVTEDTNNLDTHTDSQSSGTSNVNSSGSESYTLTRKGNIGVQPLGQEINAYRNALINVDEMFINEFNVLFLKLY